jgi:hypothetical protein
MANPDNLELLRQNVKAWNEWREKEREVRPNLSEADLHSMDLGGANLYGAILGRANLGRANLHGTDLQFVDFTQADLQYADLGEALICGANLSGADLIGADLSFSNLTRVNLHSADLGRTNLNGSNLNEADFTAAVLWGTVFADVDLRCVKGLESVAHLGPSCIDIATIYNSHLEIPETFLRGAGVPDSLLSFMRSLLVSPIEHYSCFISYSSKDQEFAGRLHADLQNNAVRCWLATEDLKIGDQFRRRIDESILLHDKLLLILSEHSIASPWVEDEVEAALERERREKRLVLIPVRIDNAVLDTPVAWAAHLRQKRHIGDFVRWKDQDAYQAAFKRLMRDLKTENDTGKP